MRPETTLGPTRRSEASARVWHMLSALAAHSSLWLQSAALITAAFIATGKVDVQPFLPEGWTLRLQQWSSYTMEFSLVPVAVCLLSAALLARAWQARRQAVYLLDFACYKPPADLKVTLPRFMRGSREAQCFTEESLGFQERISQRNGLSEQTYLPPGLHIDPPVCNMRQARDEACMVLFGAVTEVLERTGIKPKDIDFLVVNCSLFCPTPSLSAMIINQFKMRTNIVSYNLGGMGCSAGMIACGLAHRLLQHEPGKYALVVSTENITQNWYHGNDRSMLIPNTLFRMGAAAMIMTSRMSERRRAKYELEHTVRVHIGANTTAYECVFQREDDDGVVGVALNRDLVKVASEALERNLTKLGPLVLPWSEKLKFVAVWLRRRLPGQRAKVKSYMPDFAKAFDHFCLHAGGRGVIEGLGKQLSLPDHKLEPSFASLYWYGNTSSASTWYGLSFIESVQRVRAGERVWQVGFGSGFKCNSLVWRALRDVHDTKHAAWAHMATQDTQEMWAKLKAPNPKQVATEKGHTAKANGHAVRENGLPHEKRHSAQENGHAHTNGHAQNGVLQNGHKPQSGMESPEQDSSGSEDGSKISAVM